MRLFGRVAAFLAAVLVVVYGLFAVSYRSEKEWLLVLLVAAVLLGVAIWPSLPHGMQPFNRSLIRCMATLAIAFVLISVQLVRIQVVDSASIGNQTGRNLDGSITANPRKGKIEADIARGRIFAAGGQTIVGTEVHPDGSWTRTYGDPALTQLAGFYSPLAYGSSGLEAAYDDYLTGQKGGNPFTQWMDGILHRTTHGYDLTLSVDAELQDKAAQLLGNQSGSIIVMDAKTGAVVAMASSPGYDPSKLFAAPGPNSDAEVAQAKAYWTQLNSQGNSPLVLRATQGLYVPGSIFKTVTASAALDSGAAKPDTVYRDEGALTVEGRVIPGANRPDPNRVSYTLAQAYGYSLNVVYAQIGLQLGRDTLSQYATRFGIGEQIPFDLPVAVSQLATDPNSLNSQAELAVTAFGQGQLLVTPLQMALVADAVANGGQMMTPYLVQRISTDKGETLQTTQPHVWKRAISQQTASEMRQIMVESVQQGYASPAAIPGYVVGGKTGTAETGGGQPHSWFIGFAGKQDPQYVVAVIIEHGGEGTKVALPIGRAMLQAALQRPIP